MSDLERLDLCKKEFSFQQHTASFTCIEHEFCIAGPCNGRVSQYLNNNDEKKSTNMQTNEPSYTKVQSVPPSHNVSESTTHADSSIKQENKFKRLSKRLVERFHKKVPTLLPAGLAQAVSIFKTEVYVNVSKTTNDEKNENMQTNDPYHATIESIPRSHSVSVNTTHSVSSTDPYVSPYWATVQFVPLLHTVSVCTTHSDSNKGQQDEFKRQHELVEHFITVVSVFIPTEKKVFVQVWKTTSEKDDAGHMQKIESGNSIKIYFNIFFEDPPETNLDDELKKLYQILKDGFERTRVLSYIPNSLEFPKSYYNPRFTLPTQTN
jgi:hypothetical protein